MKKILIVGTIFVLMVTACSAIFKDAEPEPIDTQSAIQQTLDTENMIGTMIALTMAAKEVPGQIITLDAFQPVANPPTSTPESIVTVVATKNANCRSGPGANFDYLGALNEGQSADVLGTNTNSAQWWKVSLSTGVECWVIADAVTVSGNASSVALLDSPATPTPKPPPNWGGNWTLYVSNGVWNPGSDIEIMQTTMDHSGDSLRFYYSGWGMNFQSGGTLSPDRLIFNGIEGGSGGWSSSLYFVMSADNPNQFRGKWYKFGDTSIDGEFCGSRNGAPKPNPCRP